MSAPVPTTLGDHGQRLPSRCYGATVREFLRAAEGIGLVREKAICPHKVRKLFERCDRLLDEMIKYLRKG